MKHIRGHEKIYQRWDLGGNEKMDRGVMRGGTPPERRDKDAGKGQVQLSDAPTKARGRDTY